MLPLFKIKSDQSSLARNNFTINHEVDMKHTACDFITKNTYFVLIKKKLIQSVP